MVSDSAHAQSANKETRTNSAGAVTKTPALSRYAQNLTKLARRGAFDAVAEHESAVVPTIKILSRSKQNNPVLIAEDGSDSKAVVKILARRIATGAVPESLRQTELYSLNVTALLDGAKTSAEIETRVKAVLSEISNVEGSILFVEELHQFIGQHAAQTVSETLTEAAVAGKVRLLGATSSAAYQEYIAGDTTLEGLFKEVNVVDDLGSNDADGNNDSQSSSQSRANDFQGVKISEDLQQLIQNSSRKDRVSIILQVDDAKGGS